MRDDEEVRPARLTRRRFLQALFATALIVAAAVAVLRPSTVWPRLQQRLAPRLDPRSPTGVLSSEELDAVVAFGEVLVDGRPLSTADRQVLVDHVSERTRMAPGYLRLYRATAGALDRLAPGRFAALDVAERTRLVVARRLVDHDVRARESLWPFRRDELAVRALAVPDLIAGYYRSAAGWAVVGYDAFPGRCGSLTRYVGPEA